MSSLGRVESSVSVQLYYWDVWKSPLILFSVLQITGTLTETLAFLRNDCKSWTQCFFYSALQMFGMLNKKT